MKAWLYVFLTSVLDRYEWLSSLPGHLTPPDVAPDIIWVGELKGLGFIKINIKSRYFIDGSRAFKFGSFKNNEKE